MEFMSGKTDGFTKETSTTTIETVTANFMITKSLFIRVTGRMENRLRTRKKEYGQISKQYQVFSLAG